MRINLNSGVNQIRFTIKSPVRFIDNVNTPNMSELAIAQTNAIFSNL